VNVFGLTTPEQAMARVEWREGGRRCTQSFFGTKRDRESQAKAFAEGVYQRLAGAVDPTQVPPPVRHTVGSLWKAYVTANGSDWRPKTQRLNEARWQVFLLHVSPQTYADLIVPETLDAWRTVLATTKTEKTGETMAKNQIAHHVQLVKAVWRFARQRNMLRENLLADYAVRRGRDYSPIEVPEYTPEEFARILAQLDYRDARRWRPWAAIALDGLLAPRSNALLNVQWDDIDLSRRTVTWRKELDKVGRHRIQPLPRDAVFVLRICRVWARRQGYAGPYVFYGVQGRTRASHWTYSALVKQLHDAADRADVKRIKYRAMHSLRRMVGGNVLHVTGDITKVGDWLGDSDVRVLRKSYLRSRPGALSAVVQGSVLPATAKAPSRIQPASGPKPDSNGDETATDATGASVENTASR
jgi:integrase